MHSERHSAPRLVHEEFGVGSPSGLSLRVEDTRSPQVESLTAECIWQDPERQLGAIG